jgi:hypothetical protein
VLIDDLEYPKKAISHCWRIDWVRLRHSRNVLGVGGFLWGPNGAPDAASSTGPLLAEDLENCRMTGLKGTPYCRRSGTGGSWAREASAYPWACLWHVLSIIMMFYWCRNLFPALCGDCAIPYMGREIHRLLDLTLDQLRVTTWQLEEIDLIQVQAKPLS